MTDMEDETTVSAPYIFRGIEYIVNMTVQDGIGLCVEVEDKLTADQWRADFDSACKSGLVAYFVVPNDTLLKYILNTYTELY